MYRKLREKDLIAHSQVRSDRRPYFHYETHALNPQCCYDHRNKRFLFDPSTAQEQEARCHSFSHNRRKHPLLLLHLTVAPVALGVVALPGLSPASVGLGVAVALLDTTGLLANGGETAGFTVLYHELECSSIFFSE